MGYTREDISLTLSGSLDLAPIHRYNPYGQAFSLRHPTVPREGYPDDRGEDHPGARSYETNRDVKWICKTLQRMEAQDEAFGSRLRALERLSGRSGRRGAAALEGERSRAGG